MIIGLIRHFQVDFPPQKKLMNSEDFRQSMEVYDSSPVIKKEINIDPDDWDICYSSTLPRAITTAKTIYPYEIINTEDIREVQMYPRFKSNLKFPSIFWGILARIAWHRSHPSQVETKNSTGERIDNFYKTISAGNKKNILVVTHGFFMRLLAERLIKEGFSGKYDAIPKNGVLHIFNK
jgi:broad specificity phosphatase PhoE